MVFAVDWLLKNNDLAIYESITPDKREYVAAGFPRGNHPKFQQEEIVKTVTIIDKSNKNTIKMTPKSSYRRHKRKQNTDGEAEGNRTESKQRHDLSLLVAKKTLQLMYVAYIAICYACVI